MDLQVRGEGSRSVLFVHGTPSDRRVFTAVAERAPAGVVVGLLDLPDHGTARDEPTASLAPLEASVCGAVERLPGTVTVVGHSLGAWLAASVEAQLPPRAERFVAVAGMHAMLEEDLQVRRQLLRQLDAGELTPDALADACLGLFFGEEGTAALEAATRPMVELSVDRWRRILRRALTLGDRDPVAHRRPVTVLHGSRDGALPLARGDAFATASGGRLVTLDTASHMLPLTHPAVVAQHAYAL